MFHLKERMAFSFHLLNRAIAFPLPRLHRATLSAQQLTCLPLYEQPKANSFYADVFR